ALKAGMYKQLGEKLVTNYPETGRNAPAAAETTLLTNVRSYGEGEAVDVLIENGEIAAIGADAGAGKNIDKTINGAGQVLLPGLVDMHVHLREPGREDTADRKGGWEGRAGDEEV